MKLEKRRRVRRVAVYYIFPSGARDLAPLSLAELMDRTEIVPRLSEGTIDSTHVSDISCAALDIDSSKKIILMLNILTKNFVTFQDLPSRTAWYHFYPAQTYRLIAREKTIKRGRDDREKKINKRKSSSRHAGLSIIILTWHITPIDRLNNNPHPQHSIRCEHLREHTTTNAIAVSASNRARHMTLILKNRTNGHYLRIIEVSI